VLDLSCLLNRVFLGVLGLFRKAQCSTVFWHLVPFCEFQLEIVYSDLCWQIVSYELTVIAIFYSFKTWCFPPTWVGSASLGIDLNYAKSKVHCKKSPNNISSCSWATWCNSFDRWELRASFRSSSMTIYKVLVHTRFLGFHVPWVEQGLYPKIWTKWWRLSPHHWLCKCLEMETLHMFTASEISHKPAF
jgi:hypothetical protein